MASEKQTLTIAVGSTNPVKVKAALSGITKVFNEEKYKITAQGFSVPSGVSDQPMGDFETKKGSKNRAMNAAKNSRNNLEVTLHLQSGWKEAV